MKCNASTTPPTAATLAVKPMIWAYYVLFFLHLESRRVHIAGITRHPDQQWMEQIARIATQEMWGYLHPRKAKKLELAEHMGLSISGRLAAFGGYITVTSGRMARYLTLQARQFWNSPWTATALAAELSEAETHEASEVLEDLYDTHLPLRDSTFWAHPLSTCRDLAKGRSLGQVTP